MQQTEDQPAPLIPVQSPLEREARAFSWRGHGDRFSCMGLLICPRWHPTQWLRNGLWTARSRFEFESRGIIEFAATPKRQGERV